MKNTKLSDLTIEQLKALIQAAVMAGLASINIAPVDKSGMPDEYLNVEQAAKLLHKKVSTIYYLVHHRLVPHFKKGNRLLFSREALINWVASGKQKTTDEMGAIADEVKNRKGGERNK